MSCLGSEVNLVHRVVCHDLWHHSELTSKSFCPQLKSHTNSFISCYVTTNDKSQLTILDRIFFFSWQPLTSSTPIWKFSSKLETLQLCHHPSSQIDLRNWHCFVALGFFSRYFFKETKNIWNELVCLSTQNNHHCFIQSLSEHSGG